nr:unnamed protein product [Callosobruchus analis]
MLDVRSVTLTADCWPSRNTENFLEVTAHFIESKFEVQSVLLDCVSFSVSHTKWNLEGKILIVISDNAANMKKAINDELPLKNFGCYAHTINLIAQDSLKATECILDKEIVKVLKPLEPVTPYMSGQNYVTASSVIVLTDGLYESYRELKKDNSLTALSKDVIDCILQEYNHDWAT